MKSLKHLVFAILSVPLVAAAQEYHADDYHKVSEVKTFNTYNSVYLGSFTHNCQATEQDNRFLIDRSNIFMYTMVLGAYEHDWEVKLSWTCQDIPAQGGNVPVVTAVRVKK